MLAQQRRDAVLRALVPSGAATFAACDDVDELVTATGADQATLDALAATGLRVRLAQPRPERPPAEGAAS